MREERIVHPEQGRFFLPKNLNHASFKDRLFAYIIDGVALSVASSLLIGVLGDVGTYTAFVVTHFYFIIGHKIFGMTVGKQAMGIFIANTESTSVTWQQIVLRETVWKWLSGAILFYGFLRLIFVGEALHDKLAKTAVLTEKRKEVSFFKTALVTVCMGVLFCSSVYYLVSQTAFVGHIVVKRLTEKGHVIRGLKGNPKSGWTVEYWKGEIPQGSFELRGIRFVYDFTALYSVGSVHIKEIHVTGATLRMKELPPFLKKGKAEEITAVSVPSVAAETDGLAAKVSRVLIDKVNLAKIRIVRPNAETIEVDRVHLQSLSIDRREASIKQAYINASNIQLQIWNSQVDFETGEIILRSDFELRKGLHTAIINPVKGRLEFHGQLFNPRTINAEFFDKRLRINYSANSLAVSARGLTPSKYIKYDSSLAVLNADMRNPMCSGYACLIGGKAYGSFFHTNKKFVFKGNEIWAVGHEDDKMKLQVTSLWMNTLTSAPIFSVSTDDNIEDFVSKMYFSKVYVDLNPKERHKADRIRKDFFKYGNRTLSSGSPKGAIPSRDDFNK